MEQKNPMSRVERLHREKVTRYSIRKYSFGAASVAVAALFMFLGNGAVSVQAEEIQGTPVTESAKPQPEKDEPKPAIEAAPALNKTQLESYISEIETKLSNGSYANKTEESVAVLKADLEAAKATLANATTQAELKKAYSKLVTTVNTKLRNKPVEKKETPAVDTTNGKETVGKKAENTEPKSESNSIENTGANDPRNGQRMPAGIQFRAAIAYAEDVKKSPYDNKDSYITSGVKNSSESAVAEDAASRIMNYKTRFNTDATGKITSVDWMVYYNDHLENLDRKYAMKGEVYRNYIQIPKEVDMPTNIVRLKYNGTNPRFIIKDATDYLSNAVTFDTPAPAQVGGYKIQATDPFTLDSWPSISRGVDNLHNEKDYYFKDAVKVPETKALIDANAIDDKRVIWDKSNTGGNARDGFVWKFTTTVPDTTTNEQLKNMKAVMGMLRDGTAGVDYGAHTIAANPVNLSKADVTPPTVRTQTVKVGDTPKAEDSIANFKDLPAGTKAEFKTPVDTSTPGEKTPEIVVTFPDGSTVPGKVKVIVEEKAAEALAKPVIETDLTGKAKTQTPVVVAANPGATVELFDKDNKKIGEAVAGENGKATITPTADIPAGNVTAKASKDGKTSEVSDAKVATATAVAPTVEVPYSNADKRQVYVYTGENTDLTFTGKDETEVKDLYLRGPGGVSWNNAKDYGFTVGAVTDGAVTNGEGTVSADKRTATIKMTGVTTLKAPNQWTSFIEAKDSDDAKSMTGANYNAETDDAPRQQKPGYVQFVVKSQTDKYDIATPALADKVEVADPAKVTDAELDKIKEKLQLEYNKKNDDANIAKNTAVDKDGKIKSVTKDDKGNLVVTYTDDSTDTKPLSEFVTRDTTAPAKPVVETDLTGKAGTKDPVKVKAEPGSTVELFDKDGSSLGTGKADENGVATITPTKDIPAGNVTAKATDPAGNTSDASDAVTATATVVAPTVEVPYSNADKRQIYVYTGENTDLTFTGKDETEVKDLYLRGPGGVSWNNAKDYGFTVGAVTDGAVTNGEGTVSADKRTATIKMTGVTTLKAPNQWTSFIEAKDSDDAKSMTGANYNAETDDAPRQQKPGYVQFVVKSQTDKYDIATPALADKVEVADPAKVTDAELDKIKEKLQLEYNKKNDDANIAKNTAVDKDGKIKSVTKDDKGNLVVTYTDDSTDTKPLSEFVTRDTTAPAKPVVETDLTGKAGTKDPVKVKAEPGSTVELFDKDGSSLGTGKADENGVATITPTKDIPAGNVTAKATDPAGNTSDASDAVTATATVVAPTVEVPYSNADKRQIYVYTGENTDLTFTGKDETEVKDLYLRGPGGVSWNNAKDYGFTVGAVTDGAVTNGEGTVSADKRTATIKMTGVTTLKAPNQWTSFIEAKDSDDAKSMTGANYNAETDDAPRQQKPGYVQFVVKSQTDKYDIATPALADKVEVADPAKVTDAELDKIKEKLQLEYNKKNDDANIAKNTAVDKDGKIKSVTKDDKGNLVVTYTDDSTDTKPLSEFVTRDTTAPAKPVVETDLTGKAGTKDPVKVKAEPGSTVELFDKDGSSLGTGKADENGVATITPTKDIPAGNVTAKATDPAGNTSDASEPKVATDTTAPVTPVKPVTPAKTEVKDPEHLTDKEKEAVKDKVEKANPGKNVTVDDKGNATVTDPTTGSSATIPSSDLVEKAKETPETPVKPVTPAKTEVKDPEHLTDKEKEAVKDKVEKANPGKNVTVDDKGNATVTDPTTGSSATIPSSDLVEKAKETPETPVKPVTPAKTEVKDPEHLTDKEKEAVKDKVEKANPGKNVTVDDKGNATVTDPTTGSSATIPSSDLVEKAKETPETPVKPVTPAKTEVKDPEHLTDKEKEAVKDKVEKANPGKNVTVDDKGNATVTDPTTGSSATIPSSDLVEKAKETPETPVKPVTPAKTEVKDPEHLTDKEKEAVKDKVEKANPGKNVTVDDKGNATVTDPTTGSSATIPSSDLVEKAKETPETPVKPVTPAKTEVKDPEHLTDKEKEAVKDKVEKANPGKNVTVDDKGNATVTDPTTGSSATIPSSDLVEKAKETPETPVKPVTPAKTEVKDPEHLTDKEKEAVKDKVEKANPGKNVTVDDKGNATVTDPTTGSSATIPSSDLVEKAKETPETPVKPVTPAKTEVKDPEHLTDKEKEAVKDKVEKANPGKNVTVDDKGNATVTDPTTGSSATIPSSDLVEKAKETPETPVKPVTPAKTEVKDPEHLTDKEKEAVKDKVEKANPGKNVTVDDKGNATVTDPTTGSSATIPSSDLVEKAKETPETPVKPVTPAKTEVKDPEHLTDKEKEAVKDKVEKANPGKNVTVDDKGNATVTDPTTGSSATIPSSDLVEKAKETPETPVKPVTPAKTEVKDPEHLTDKEKEAVKDKVEKANPGKNVTVDDKGNATVTDPTTGSSATIPSSDLVEKAKETPETPVKPVTPAKTEVKDPEHLTDKEKEAVKDKVEKANPGKNVTVDDKGNATVTDPTTGSSATIPSSDLVEKAKETPETPVKPVTPAKTEVKDPEHLTDKEKEAVKDKVEKANPGKNVTVDDKGNATVTDPTTGSSATIPSSDLVEKAKETPETPVKPVTPAKTEVKDPEHLTDKEKEAVKDKVEKANPGKNVTVDDKGNATVTDPTTGSSATIPSSDLVEKAKETPETPVKPVTPAKTEVKDPEHLTDKEKEAVKDKVEKANPGKNVTVDDKGNATVTDPTTGSSATIPSSDLVEKAKETPETPVKPVTPAKTEVKDPEHLTDKEKEAVKDKVEKANPGKNVTVDDKGNATVTDPTTGSSATIPSSDLVEKAKETPETPVKPVTPAKTEVKDPEHLTDKEKEAVKDKVEKANPGKNVTVDDKGNATVTDPTTGSSATIPSSDLVEKAKETPETPVKPVTPAKTEVKDPEHLTDKEKEAVKDKVEKANPGKNVTVDDKGNATVTDPTTGSSATIPSSDLVEKAKETPETPVKPVTPAKTEVKDPEHLTDKEKEAVKDKVEKANPGKNVTVDDKGNATVTDPTTGSSATIPSSDLVEKAKETPETPVKPVTPAKTEVKDPEHLTDKEKEAVKDKVEKANPGKNVTVDDKGNATVTDPTTGSSATIPSSDLVEKAKETPETPVKPVTPAKTEVKDPEHLTDKEKEAVKDKVEKANPGKNVTVDDKGNATVTDPTTGSSATIPSSDLVEKAKETPETPVKPVTPAKTEVKDPEHLTDKEKEAVKDKVEKANPGKNVTVDDKGNATVTDPTTGSSATIPSSDLVEKAKETPETPVKPVTPAKTEVKDPEHLTDKEKEAVKDKVEKANPGKNVTVDDKGNATVTDPTTGSSATIPSSDLVEKAKETPETPVKPVTPAKTEVKDPEHLTDKEKEAVKDKVEKANPGKNVTVDDKGNATVTDPTTGSSATIPSSDLVEKAKETPETPVKPVTPAKTEVKDPEHLTDKEKEAVKDKVEKANPGKNVTVDDKGNATVTDPTTGSSATIPSSDLVEKAKETPETPVKPVTPAKTEVKDPEHLTDKEKEAVKDKVEKANPGKNVTVDDKGNATVTDPTTGSSATIPSSDLVEKAKETPETPVKPVTPAKTEVKDPEHLTDKEKEAVKDKVEKANPGKNVTVDDKGNATVTDPTTGSSATIPSSDLVEKAKETPETPVKPVTPAKTEVKDPEHLTDKEKEAVKDKVEKANPGKNVTVDDKGNATVTDPTTGSSATIPSSDLVEKAKETPETPVKPVTPAKTEVKDPEHLTDKEKEAVKDKVEKANPGKNVTVDDKGNATVTDPTTGSSATIPSSDLVEKAKETPETPVKPVTPAKTEVKDPEHLTDKEKEAVKDKVEKANPGKNVTVDDKGNATVTDPTTGSSATIPSSDLVEKAKETPETPVKPVTPAKTEVKDPEHLTDKEKEAVKDKVEKANPGKNVTVDDKGNATVTDPTTGSSATIPSSDLVEKAKETPETPVKPVTPAKTEVKDPEHLTDKEKEAVKDKVEKANPGKNVTVDDKGNATVTDPTTGSSATIPSSDLVEKAKETPETPVKPVTPAKTEVKDPEHLTDKEKEAVKDKVEKANPGKNVTVDDKGNATVTDPTTGSSATIPSSDLVEKAKETPETPVKPVTPAKTEVKDPEHLTDKEKEAVKDKVEKANPGKNVTVDDKGNATVTDPTTGSSATIPSSDLVEKAKETPETPVKPVTPAKTEVKDPEHLTDKEKEAVKDKVEKANPGKNVTVDDKGNATVTDPTTGSSATIPSSDLVEKAKETPETPVKPVTPAKTEVKDPEHLTDKEKEAVKDKVEKANPGKNVTVDDKGNATVTDPTTGSSATIPSSDLVEKAKETPVTPVKPVTPAKTEVKDPAVTPVKDPSNLTDAEKAKVAEEVKKSNPTAKDIKVNKDGSVVVTFEDGTTAFIPADKTVKSADSNRVQDPSATPANDQAAQTPAVAPATTPAAANASQTASAQANARKAAKELPNTGTADSTVAMVAAAASALLGLGLAGRRRKEDEEA